MSGMYMNEYKSSTARSKIQAQDGQIPSRLLPNTDASQIWKRIHKPTIMPKHKSFMWLFHNKAIPHGKMLAHFSEISGYCRHCITREEDLAHAYFNCPMVQPFWQRVEDTLSDPTDVVPLDFESAAELDYCPKKGISPSTTSVPLVCAFWSIYRTRIKAWKEQVSSPPQAIYTLWKNSVKDILLAKRRTAIKKGSIKTFIKKWAWLANSLDLDISSFLSMTD
jgi:hypothetical protein